MIGDVNRYFEVATLRTKDKIICELRSKGLDVVNQLNSQIIMKVAGVNKNINFVVVQEFKEILRNVFMILGSHYRNISKDSYHRIEVQTDQQLEISQIGGSDNWIISNEFSNFKQIISIEMGAHSKKPWKLIIFNSKTGQKEVVEF